MHFKILKKVVIFKKIENIKIKKKHEHILMQFYKTVKFKKGQNLECFQNEQILRKKCESIINFHENSKFQKK